MVDRRPRLDHLTRAELRAHQYDLDLARQIQSNLLPSNDIALEYWDTQYRYEPAGAVGGDYCELIALDNTSVFFAVGDVVGKGVAASLMMRTSARPSAVCYRWTYRSQRWFHAQTNHS